MLPLWVRVDLEAMAMKGHSSFQDTHWVGSYPFAGKQSVYSTSPTDWAMCSIELLVK